MLRFCSRSYINLYHCSPDSNPLRVRSVPGPYACRRRLQYAFDLTTLICVLPTRFSHLLQTRMISPPILSYPILTYPILSCSPLLSYPTLLYPTLPYSILSCYPLLSSPLYPLLSTLNGTRQEPASPFGKHYSSRVRVRAVTQAGQRLTYSHSSLSDFLKSRVQDIHLIFHLSDHRQDLVFLIENFNVLRVRIVTHLERTWNFGREFSGGKKEWRKKQKKWMFNLKSLLSLGFSTNTNVYIHSDHKYFTIFTSVLYQDITSVLKS